MSKKKKGYTVVLNGETVNDYFRPGKYAGSRKEKVFGRLDCSSGKKLMKAENRIFFAGWEDAIEAGYRPCKICKPDIIRLGDKLSCFHPALDLTHVAIFSTNPRPYPKKPMVCFYVTLKWAEETDESGVEMVAQSDLETWFPYPTAIKKAIKWGEKLGLPVIEHGIIDETVHYVSDKPPNKEQLIQTEEIQNSDETSVLCYRSPI